MITFDWEVTTIWDRKLGTMSLMILSTRWVMVLQALLTLPPVPREVSDKPKQVNQPCWHTYLLGVSPPDNGVSTANLSRCAPVLITSGILLMVAYLQAACKLLRCFREIKLRWIALGKTVFTALRVFALWRYNRLLPAVILLLGLIPIGTILVSIFIQ